MKDGRREFLRHAGWAAAGWWLPAIGCRKEEQRESIRGAGPPSFDEPRVASLAEAAAPGSTSLPDGLDPSAFTMYTRTPLTLETLRSRLPSEPITPAQLLFVRNNLPMPHPRIVHDPDAWTLRVSGVKAPRSFSLPELQALGTQTVVSVLQCSGNGRRFFPHGPSGSPWGIGAAGCLRWTGVPVGAVLDAAGGKLAGMRFLTSTGGDPIPRLPKGVTREMLLVERSIPLGKALQDCVLAWEMNGAPIPLTHGGPLRVIVPGFYGVNHVKYVESIACTEHESDAKIQQSSYRIRPVGQKGGPDQPTMWRMNVKSWVGGPGADFEPVVAGPATIRGVAFSGERSVRQVEVSIDDGKTWKEARLQDGAGGDDAWRPFAVQVDLPTGHHRLISRATDTAGEQQPEHRIDNERGYGNNSWRDMALDIEVFATMAQAKAAAEARRAALREEAVTDAAAELSDAARAGRRVFLAQANPACGNCHTLQDAGAGMSIGPNLDQLRADLDRVRNAVRNGSGIMQPYGDQLTSEQIEAVAKYVLEARRRG